MPSRATQRVDGTLRPNSDPDARPSLSILNCAIRQLSQSWGLTTRCRVRATGGLAGQRKDTGVDGQRFDALAKSLATVAASRRAILQGLGAGALSGLIGLMRVSDAEAKKEECCESDLIIPGYGSCTSRMCCPRPLRCYACVPIPNALSCTSGCCRKGRDCPGDPFHTAGCPAA